MNNVQVLISCMDDEPKKLLDEMNLESINTVVVSQVGYDNKVQEMNKLYIYSSSRGLSKSRNIALMNSNAEYCLLSDDDEFFYDDLEYVISETFTHNKADIILFDIENFGLKKKKKKKLNRVDLLRACSIQIAFKRKSIIENSIQFDEKLGSGTLMRSGEETKFLLDSYKKGLNIIYVPITIAKLDDTSNSNWFFGFDEEFFFIRGKTTRYIYGYWAYPYALYFLVRKHKNYRQNMSFFKAFCYIMKGILSYEDININGGDK